MDYPFNLFRQSDVKHVGIVSRVRAKAEFAPPLAKIYPFGYQTVKISCKSYTWICTMSIPSVSIG